MPTPPVTAGAIVGQPPTLEWIGVDQLRIDEGYQRGIDTPQSRKIIVGMVRRWDWRLCQPLNVSRRADGSLYVVDGQHRLEGARERGDVPHLPCVVTALVDTAEEAHTFVALNSKRQRLSQGSVFAASLAAQDPDAIRTQQLIAEAGLTLARHANTSAWKPGEIFCAPAIQTALKRYGDRVVSNALVALGEAYADRVMVRAATLLQPLYLIYSDEAKQPGFDPDCLIEALGSLEQLEWLDAGRDVARLSPALSGREAIATAMMEQYTALRRDRAA